MTVALIFARSFALTLLAYVWPAYTGTASVGRRLWAFPVVWVAVTGARYACVAAAHAMQWPDGAIAGFANYFIPLAIGVLVARLLLPRS